MPIYEYRCASAHTVERIRKYEERDDELTCGECGTPMGRLFSAHHRQPDGIYSYDHPIGDAEKFDRKWEGMKAEREGRG